MISTNHVANPLVDVAPADLDILARVEHHFIASAPSGTGPIEALAGRALLSAVLFGGLNDPDYWSGWLTAAIKARSIESHEIMWFNYKGKVDRTWYPDPVTGCYIRALRSCFRVDEALQAIGDPPNLLWATLRALAEGAPDVCQLQKAASKGPVWLNSACVARLHLRIPGMLAEHATGKTRTYARTSSVAKPDDKLEQLESFLKTAERQKPWIPYFKDAAFWHLKSAFFDEDKAGDNDKFRKSASRIKKGLNNQIEWWSKPPRKGSVHHHILLWLKLRIDTGTRSELPRQSHVKPATARRYLWVLASYDWEKIRNMSIRDDDVVAELKNAFEQLDEYGSAKSLSRHNLFKSVLRSLSTYLNAQNPKIRIWSSDATEEQRSQLPRRIVLNHLDFMLLMDLLDRWGALPMPSAQSGTGAPRRAELKRAERAEACKLAATVMFRTGLRGQEVSNLALNDISFERACAELVVRGSATRSNKNRFARRTLPLHALLEKAELDQLRHWHTARCNEEFRSAPRAKLFPVVGTQGLKIDQYLLEPIDAAIRLLFGNGSLSKSPRDENGYWYALASPLRHSFASHLIACLSLPDEPVRLPAPLGLTPDLVSLDRKKRLCDALLRSRQHGLALMQAVRYVMGHATYKRALETYIHNVDWLLAAHLWRPIHQLPMTAREVSSLLKLGATKTAKRPLRSDRQMRRLRASAAEQSCTTSALPQMPRGRPPVALAGSGRIRSFSGTYRAFLPDELPDTVFGKVEHLAHKARPVCKGPTDPKLETQWLTIHNFLRLRAKRVSPDEAAKQLWLEEETCQLWAQRADELATITKRARDRKSSASSTGTKPELRFPQLKVDRDQKPRDEAAKLPRAGGFPHPRGDAAKLIDQIWSQRAQIEKPQRWASVLSLLARWQSEPPIMRSQSSVERLAKTYLRLGISPRNLGVRVATGPWETYNPGAPPGSGGSSVVRLSPIEPSDGGGSRGLHNTFLYALLLLLIASDNDFGSLSSSSSSRKGKRLPKQLRPPRLAVVVVTSVAPETVETSA